MTLDTATPEDVRGATILDLYREVCDALRVRHERRAILGEVVCRGFCRCGYRNIDGRSDLCARLDNLGNIDLNDPGDWLARARQLRDDAK